ncbi:MULTISPECIES: bifunctional glutamate--cysteine ligase GshA/glutathione synthetase GshB [unclassified Granulicatella]|uniref:bifunctional glutamate--cysteine ligase GshA/glutathione synthetase GshB n=1 Tax=unclassified Granulicatella TaxID=2630493 RepID=UPI001073B39C|nr:MULTISPECIES: bifunctional glutamate--cysteine ligase GshA/glutathione synthetase GshB [unclassified Granulicatella]MBF0779836.1 bifunctional glutamate--cysteine ligase GshA/glutathione synthetase GshB [Granulicatella sp. 19428wC4_WM01]TFU96136.1 bifunctional glutamate--cysteine ligase GshA/glutathione synthetase GshB [Granulicatella sp. WM01]
MKNDILKHNLEALFLQGTIGIEREGQRVLKQGHIAKSPHPKVFGDRQYHPYIQTDFAESQLELVSPAKETEALTYQYLQAIHEVAFQKIPEQEYIWPMSMPCIFPEEKDIIEAQLNANDTSYREYLSKKYGKFKQMVSGIHYNFGLSSEFIQTIEHLTQGKLTRNTIYLKMARQFVRYQWLLVYLYGASPVADAKYFTGYDALDHPVRSIRASRYGYVNKEHIHVPFDSLEHYAQTLEHLVATKELIAEKEFYSSVRFRGAKTARELIDKGVQYMEFRVFDLNPFAPYGISEQDMRFIHLFLLMLVWIDEEDASCSIALGKQKSEKIALAHPLERSNDNEGEWLIAQMLDMAKQCQLPQEDIVLITEKGEQLHQPEKTVGGQLWSLYQKEQSMTKIGMALAKRYKKEHVEHVYGLRAFDKMELSTQAFLFDAIQYGISVDVLDESDQFVKLSYKDHIEYVKNGNMTSKDSYISPLMMANKVVTKKVLKDAGFRVPESVSCWSIQDAKRVYPRIVCKPIVVKPKTTNFGLGITIFKQGVEQEEDFLKAVSIALAEDSEVMIEEFIEGTEYRFFVLGNRTKAVLLRVPANVVGDGVHTIEELVEQKNKHALRGDGVRTPLKKIQLGDIELLQLKQQGYTKDSVVVKDDIVFLRENSNISTGGDSIDMTDYVHESYKKIARDIAQAMHAKICGVDLIIPDIHVSAYENNQTYGVIEANFNPMMMMHIYPSMGKSRRLTRDVLHMLFPEIDMHE